MSRAAWALCGVPVAFVWAWARRRTVLHLVGDGGGVVCPCPRPEGTAVASLPGCLPICYRGLRPGFSLAAGARRVRAPRVREPSLFWGLPCRQR